MYYMYNINNKIYRVWVGRYSNCVGVQLNSGKDVNCIIQEDNDEKYFVFKNTKVFLKDFIRLSLEEFMNKVNAETNNKGYVFDYDLITMILSEGANNLIFSIPLNIVDIRSPFGINLYDGNKTVNRDCFIDQDRYSVSDCYKLAFRRVDADYDTNDTCISRSFYVEDFLSYIKNGFVTIKRKEN